MVYRFCQKRKGQRVERMGVTANGRTVALGPFYLAILSDPPSYTPNAKRQTPNAKRQTPNAKRQTPNAKRQTPFRSFTLALPLRLQLK